MPGGVGGARASLASTRFGRAASEKDPQGHLAGVVPRRAAIPARSRGAGLGSGCWRRWGGGSIGMAACRRPTTGRARMPSGVGRRRCRPLGEGIWPAGDVLVRKPGRRPDCGTVATGQRRRASDPGGGAPRLRRREPVHPDEFAARRVDTRAVSRVVERDEPGQLQRPLHRRDGRVWRALSDRGRRPGGSPTTNAATADSLTTGRRRAGAGVRRARSCAR